MIQRVNRLDEKIFSYILRGKEYNTYIISDLETLGLESGVIELYKGIVGRDISYILMRYGESFVIYSEQATQIDVSEIREFMRQYHFEIRITGKREIIEKIADCFSGAELLHNKFAVITPDNLKLYYMKSNNFTIEKNCTVQQVIDAYSVIDEYKEKYQNKQKAIKRITTNNLNGRYYGIKCREGMAAIVCSAAESKKFAMISEVGTAEKYRNKGLSKVLVSTLCKDLFDMGKEKLSIFYRSQIAEHVYKKVGFQEIGEYSILVHTIK